MPPKISIIIPAYNQEKYLRQCLDSILTQTFSDFEVIIVDDGSTDQSGQICDEYVNIDSRFHVIHQNNEGVASARNCGINAAQGEYITFVDSDDWTQPLFLEMLIASTKTSDHVITGHREFGELEIDNSVPEAMELELNSKTGRLLDVDANNLFWNKNYLYCWGQLFKLSIIIENNLRFNEELMLGEDSYFVLNYLSCANRISMVPGGLYMYRRYRVSFWEKYAMDLSKMRKHIEALTSALSIFEQNVGCSLPNLFSKNVNVYVNCFFQNLTTIVNPFLFQKTVKDFLRTDYHMVQTYLPLEKIAFFDSCKHHAVRQYCKINARRVVYRMRTIPTFIFRHLKFKN